MKCQSAKEVSIEKQDAEMDLLDLEEEIFMDCVFDVPSEERSPAPSYATPPMFVPSIGRGVRRAINPLDIPLPQAYYDQLERKRKATHDIGNPQSSRPVNGASKPKRGSGRSSTLPERVPRSQPRGRGRGRGRVMEDGFQKTKPSVLQVKELERFGLPNNGNRDVEEGKARLMQMFLGRQSQFEIETNFNAQYDSSGSSIRSAPNFDLRNDKDFPDMMSKVMKGMPFKSSAGGSLDENLRRRARGLITKGKCQSSGDDGVSSSDGTGERRGKRSSCDADVDTTSYEPPTTQHSTRSSNENSSQVLEGPNVLELTGLPTNLSKEDLGDLLMGCGEIVEMRLLRDTDLGACIGLAYVRMENEEACELAVSSYHDMESPFSDRYDGEVPQLSVRILAS